MKITVVGAAAIVAAVLAAIYVLRLRKVPSPGGRTVTGDVPILLTVDEAAWLLRTTRKGIYAMVERQQLPGVVRLGRRVLIRQADLVSWLRQKSAPSPQE